MLLNNENGGVEILSAIWWGNWCVWCVGYAEIVNVLYCNINMCGEWRGFLFLWPPNGPKSKRGNSNPYEYRQQQAEWIRFLADRLLILSFFLSSGSGNPCAISAGIQSHTINYCIMAAGVPIKNNVRTTTDTL